MSRVIYPDIVKRYLSKECAKTNTGEICKYLEEFENPVELIDILTSEYGLTRNMARRFVHANATKRFRELHPTGRMEGLLRKLDEGFDEINRRVENVLGK